MYRFRIAVALCLIVSLSPVQAQLIFASGFEDGEGGTMGIPPNPEDVAPDRDGAGNTGPCEAYGFLFNGAQPVQINVDEASIDCDKLAVLGGRVVDASMAPVIGVAVMVKDRPEFGMTLTRADGEYDLAVNGGGPLTLLFSRDGLLNADRETQVPPRADLTLEDVMLVALDGNVTTVMANMPEPQLVSGSMRTDSDGSRTARLMIPANTTMMMGNGAGGMDPMSQLDVRITEYTVGENGPMAMPADLPPTSGYTYAVEFSADEGITSPVTFNQALASYNENFLGFPTGTVIPHGWYDRELGQWVPAENGRVIEILTEAAGTVTVAVDSTGAAADTSKLMQAGISSDELEMLAQLFQPGDTLWRVPIRHFSPHDYNFPLPDDAEPPPPPPPLPDDVDVDTSDPDYGRIEYQTQVFQETLGLVGVPFDLHYSSYRTPGRNAERTLRVPITRSSVPTGLSGAQLVVNVAGIRNEYLLGPDPGQSFTIRWNGRDRYDRPVFGTQNLSYELAYRFPITYRFAQVDGTGAEPPRVFGRILQLENSQGRSLVITTQPRRFRRTVPGLLDWRPLGVGGWSPSVHHFYDQAGGIVYRGDGTRQTDGGSELIYTINNFAGGGTTIEDGAPATEAFMENAEQMAIASDGTLYYTESDGDFGEYRIRAVDPDGTVRTVLPFGGTDCPSENELVSDIGITGVAASSFASQVAVLAVDKQDRLYFAAAFCPDMPFVDEQEEEFYPFLIYRIEGDRAVRVAGTELINFSPVDGFFDDVSALDFQMTSVEDLEFFDDGTMAILEYGRFYRLEPDGSVRHFAGVANCFPGFCEPDGALAKTAVLELPNDMATLPDGGIVFAGSQFDSPIRKITRDGIVQTILPSQEERSIYNITAGPDGVIYAATTSEDFPFVQELLAIEPDGSTRLIAGGPVDQPYASEGGPARQQRFGPLDIDIGPDGAIYGTVFPGITRIVPGDEPVPLADTLVASSDSPEVFRFAANGRHQETRHALTGGLLWQFGYNDEGFLVSVTDGYGNASTIARDGSGQPTSVTGPDGQVTILSVDGNGFLASSTTPGNASIDFEYTTQGLLTAVETATDDRYTMVYDSDGLLTSVTDPADATTTLARQFIADGTRVTVTTPEGEVTRYDRTVGNSRDVTTSISRPDGTVETVLVETNGTVTRMLADGTALEDVLAPDPRFAMQSPYIVQSSLSLPGGTTQITDRSRSATLENTGGLLDLQSLTETITVAGQSTAYQYTASSQTEQLTFPDGRILSRVLDEQGASVSLSLTGETDLVSVLDPSGRAISVTRDPGPNQSVFGYGRDGNGRISQLTQPDSSTLDFAWDADGRRDFTTLEDDSLVMYTHDAAGFQTSIAPPDQPAYVFQPDNRQLVTGFTVPVVESAPALTSHGYDDDRNRTSTIFPDGRSVATTFNLDRPTERTFSRGSLVYGYDPVSGHLTQVTAPGVTLDRSYDGVWLSQESWSGALSGSVELIPAADELLISRVTVNNADPITYSYDSARQVTGAGALTLTRDPTTGAVATTSLGVVDTSATYDARGRLSSFDAQVNSSSVYSFSLTYDVMERIATRSETIQGISTDYAYTYDVRGRLETVTVDAELAVTYSYDTNGNRTAVNTGSGPVATSYDDQDRIIAAGSVQFDYLDSGFLSRITDGADVTQYEYDELGHLNRVVLPSGSVITYAADGLNRRVTKAVDGAASYGLVYQDRIQVAARLNAANQVDQRYVHILDSLGAPEYIVAGSNTYRVIKDVRGSVRLVIDTGSGAIAQRLDYDAWGVVTADSSPGFQPFGFAGGQYDPDTDLVRFGDRDYHAASGRWTARDPWLFEGGDTNLYSYVLNQPTSLVDPIGRNPAVVASVYKGIAVTLANDAVGAPPFTAGALVAANTGTVDPVAFATSATIFAGRKLTAKPVSKAVDAYYKVDELIATPEDLGFDTSNMSADDAAFAQLMADGFNNGTYNGKQVRAWADALREKYARNGKRLGR